MSIYLHRNPWFPHFSLTRTIVSELPIGLVYNIKSENDLNIQSDTGKLGKRIFFRFPSLLVSL